MRVLGIDPGIGRTGVALVDGAPGALRLEAACCIETTPHLPDPTRLDSLFSQLEAFISAHGADVAAVEDLFFSANRTTAIQVAQARGVALLALARAGIDVVGYAPNQVKDAVAGYGAARKPQVKRMTLRLLDVADIGGHDDAVDACAVAICHHHRRGLGYRRVEAGTAATGAVSPLDRAVAAAQRLGATR